MAMSKVGNAPSGILMMVDRLLRKLEIQRMALLLICPFRRLCSSLECAT